MIREIYPDAEITAIDLSREMLDLAGRSKRGGVKTIMHAANESGRVRERMSDTSFRAMSVLFRVRDAIRPPGTVLETIGIREGMTVVDYGCGPGSYVKTAAECVGPSGVRSMVDIHELGIDSVRRRIRTDGLRKSGLTQQAPRYLPAPSVFPRR